MEKFIESLVFEKSVELLAACEVKWFEIKTTTQQEPKTFDPLRNLHQSTALREYARKLHEQDIITYNNYREQTRKSDHAWIKTVLRTGTIGDKISANCILIQDSAVHNLHAIDNLVDSVKLSKKRECMLAIDALKDLFINYLLPKRVLKSFHEHPFEYLANIKESRENVNKRLMIWYFEALLKVKYNNFLRALQLVFQDTITATKNKVASTLFEILKSKKPEQEKMILETVINKLGDPDYKVASKTVFHVKNMLYECPKMKNDVLLEIERLVSRQNINQKAQYYGFCCMNQFILTRQETEVANRLLLIYFSFFKKFIKTKEVDSRMLNVLLTGVNRAYKYAKMSHDEIDKNLNTLFKLVHVTNFNVAIQALMLLNQVMDSRDDMVHRYYNALYRKMFDLEWRNMSKQTFFLNLLFNSINKDEAIPRIKAFVKRLLQICFSQNVPFVCGSMMLISELLKSKKNIFQLDPISLVQNAPVVTNEDGSIKKSTFDNDDDEEERFRDVKTESSDEEEANPEKAKPDKYQVVDDEADDESKSQAKNSWIHKKNQIFKRHDKYDVQERNPLYCGADKTLTYELLLFRKHFHPTVCMFATKLMNNQPVEYGGDPMEDFTLVHFLDRFIQKNPKKNKDKSGKPAKKSVFEPIKSDKGSSIKNIPTNSKAYLNLDIKSIPEEEKIFYNFYKMQAKKKPEIDDDISEAGSISDTEFDDFLAKTETDGAGDDWTVDFADGVKNKRNKKKKSKKGSDDDESDDDDIMDEFEDEDEDADFTKAMNDEMDGDDDFDLDEDDENVGEMDDEDNDVIESFATYKKKSKKSSSGKENLSSLFAAADDFSDLINQSSKYEAMGVGSSVISNKDNAHPRQLKWEMKMDDSKGGAKSRGGIAKKSSKKFGGGKSNGNKKNVKQNNKRKR